MILVSGRKKTHNLKPKTRKCPAGVRGPGRKGNCRSRGDARPAMRCTRGLRANIASGGIKTFVLSSEGPKRLRNTCSVGYVLFCPCSQKSEALALQEHPRQAPQRRRIKSDGMAVMAGIWLRVPDLTRPFCGSFPGVLK